MTALYLLDASHALAEIDHAIAHAMRFLPESVKAQHWQAEKRGEPSPWSSVRYWYQGQEDYLLDIAQLLVHLSLLSQARAALKTILVSVSTEPPNLTLARMRRQTNG